MSDPSRSLPFLLRATGLAALLGLGAGAAPWEDAALASRVGLALLLAAPWLVVVWSLLTPPAEARWRRPLAALLLLAAVGLVLASVWTTGPR